MDARRGRWQLRPKMKSGRETFADRGMPFPLFEAPIADASGFEPEGACEACGATDVAVFKTDVGPACYACFRAGRAEVTIDTELGMVRPEDAARGRTHGTPRPPSSGYELEPLPIDPNFPEPRWFSVKVAPEQLIELVRTPQYSTCQGEQWQFCCGAPAVFMGAWDLDRWDEAARERGENLSSVVRATLHLDERETEHLTGALEQELESPVTYVFRCRGCGRLLGHWDMD